MKLPFNISLPFFGNPNSKPKLSYVDQGRSGYVVYKDAQSEISFYYEFGGGDCVAVINIPSPAKWEAETKRPLADRQHIITFIAEQARKDQSPKGSYRVTDGSIELLAG